MLNCCIERRKARETSVCGDALMTVKRNSLSDEDDEDEEFFECESDTAAADTSQSQSDDVDSLPYQADGRLKPCAELRLLSVNERLYVPITQEPAPMTEDMLEEHAEVLARYSIRTACMLAFYCGGVARHCGGAQALPSIWSGGSGAGPPAGPPRHTPRHHSAYK